MAKGRRRRLSWIPWKAGFFLAAAIAVLELVPAPVPARDSGSASTETQRVELFTAADRTEAPARPRPRAIPAPATAAPDPSKAHVAVADYPVRAELPVGRTLDPGEWAWTDQAVPSAGETLVVVNLRGQTLSLYRAGYEIGRARIIYGADEKPTPIGTFPILEKNAVHFSSLYGGAPMPYMLRLTRDGVSIHGSQIAEDLVTHGCVGLPKEFAALLFRQVKVGDRVVVWRG